MNFEEKVAIVTDESSGMGEKYTYLLAENGAKAIFFLASEDSKRTTGLSMSIHGDR